MYIYIKKPYQKEKYESLGSIGIIANRCKEGGGLRIYFFEYPRPWNFPFFYFTLPLEIPSKTKLNQPQDIPQN